ncbi:hypothetical protein HZ326_10425 [Fusarium oxysporum f. sp. albedinis]|nr:hypothetical protein HZ326_10425 [Fusarium oxysporum f. sp. albedinis]
MLSISPNIAEDAISSGVARCQYHPPFRVFLLFSSLDLFWLSFLLPSVLRPRFTALDFHLFSIVPHVAFFCILD